MKRNLFMATFACALTNLAIPILPGLAAQDISKKQMHRAVFLALPIANYDKQILRDAIGAVKSQAGFETAPLLSDQEIKDVIKLRMNWVKKVEPKLQDRFELEIQRLRASGLDEKRFPGQHSLFSIQESVPLPVELAAHKELSLIHI